MEFSSDFGFDFDLFFPFLFFFFFFFFYWNLFICIFSAIKRGIILFNGFPIPKGLLSKSRKQVSNVQNSNDCPELETPGTECNDCPELETPRTECRSHTASSVTTVIPNHQCDRSFCSHTLWRHATKSSEVPRSVSSKTRQDPSGSSSSTSSSSILAKILDRCIDGEQQIEKNRPNFSIRRESSFRESDVESISYGLEVQKLRERVKMFVDKNVSLRRELSPFRERNAESRSYRCELESLRDKVRVLVEKNLSLQREVPSFNQRDVESRSSGLEVQRLRERLGALAENNILLQTELSSFHERDVESGNYVQGFLGDNKHVAKEDRALTSDQEIVPPKNGHNGITDESAAPTSKFLAGGQITSLEHHAGPSPNKPEHDLDVVTTNNPVSEDPRVHTEFFPWTEALGRPLPDQTSLSGVSAPPHEDIPIDIEDLFPLDLHSGISTKANTF